MKVHHITSGYADKNLGKAINDVIEFLPEDDWICLRDIDTLPMAHRYFFRQCNEIAKSGKFDLVGCMTNRLGLEYQLHGGKISNDWNMENHLKIGHELFEKYNVEVEETKFNVAGVMMLFSKKTWDDAGRFPEGGVQVEGCFMDYWFNNRVRKIGGRVGIAKGIYLFHLYRHWADNVRVGYQHLL